jgi:PAS domain S-box-containing protein
MSKLSTLDEAQLLQILSLYANPIAIYTSDRIIIEMANDAMLAAWGRGKEVIGLPIGEALPEIGNQPFEEMLRQVWITGIDDVGEAILADLVVDGKLQRFYFDYAYRAIKDDQGQVYAIMHTAHDVTEMVENRELVESAKEKDTMLKREQMLNEELTATNEELYASTEELHAVQNMLSDLNEDLEERVKQRTLSLSRSESRLRYLLSDAPIAIAVFVGPDLIIESANKKVLEAWGKTERIIGMPLHIAVPELVGQEFLTILDNVYSTGIAYHGYEVKALLEHNGKLEDVYSNFVYQPLKDEEGNTVSIMLAASVVSEQVAARHHVQKLNEELILINEELSDSQQNLITLNRHLKENQMRLDQILTELPAPIVVLLGPNQIVSTTNEALLQFWDRTKEEVSGRPMLDIFPELRDQPFPALWKHVLETGERIVEKEKLVIFKDKHTGKDKFVYVDYYYQSLTDLNGERVGVLATVLDVTHKVIARRKVEEAENQLRLAIDATELGTFYYNSLTEEFVPSARLKEILGFYQEEHMPYNIAFEQILPEYKPIVTKAVKEAIATGHQFDMEYPIIGYRDQQIRWVKAAGKFYMGETTGDSKFTGTIQDITQRKLEEQRKDDFLSIASHELKTPVTTLKGALQLLVRYKPNLENPVVPKLIDQASISVEKITILMDDLLNSARTNEGNLQLHKKRFVVSKLLSECCTHIRLGGKYHLLVGGDLWAEVEADESRIDQVIVNLVNNAVKYASESFEIFMNIENNGDHIKVSVKDYGPGIPQDKLSHLFERYYRADYAGMQYSGLGLGLYISSEIIKRHGGQIGVDSELGNGSTFWFTLPSSNSL